MSETPEERIRRITSEALSNQEADSEQSDRVSRITRDAFADEPVARDDIESNYLSGFGGGASRVSLSRADTDDERTLRLRQEMPDAQFFGPSATTDNRPTYQSAPGEPLSYVAPTIADAYEQGGFLGATGEILQRGVNLLAPGAESIAAEGALLAASANPVVAGGRLAYGVGRTLAPAGIRLARYIGAGGLGGAIGEGSRQVTQTAQGIQGQSVGEQAAQVTGSAGAGALGGGIGFGGEALVRRVTSAGPLGVTAEGQRAASAMRDMADLPGAPRTPAWVGVSSERVGLMPQQVAREGISEIVKRVAGAASRVWPRINNYTQRQREVIANAIEQARQPGQFQSARQELTQAVDELNASFAADLRASTNITGMNAEELGIAIAAGRQAYEELSKQGVDALYNAARAGGDFRFNTTPIDGPEGAIARIEETILRPLPGRDGQPIQPNFPGAQQLREWIGQWRRLDVQRAGIDDIRTLRGNLYEMSQPDAAGARMPERAARMLRSALSEVLDSPTAYIAPDGSVSREIPQEILGTWRSAQDAARVRFQNLENSTIMEIANSDTPFAMAESFMAPGNYDQIIALRRALNQMGDQGASRWERIRDGFKSDLANNISELPERLAAYEGRNALTLDAILTPTERQAFESTASAIRRVRQTDIPEIARNQETARAFAEQMFQGRIPSARPQAIIDSLGALAQQRGVDSWADTAPGQAVRASVFDTIVNNAIEQTPRGVRVNQNRLNRAVQNAQDRGLSQLLTAEDLALLENVRMVNAIVEQSVSDVGTSIAGASQAQVFTLGDFLGTLPYLTIGRVLTSNAGRQILLGSGIRTPATAARTINLMGRLVDDATLSQEQRADLAGFMRGIDSQIQEQERLRDIGTSGAIR